MYVVAAELAMRDWMNMALTVSNKNETNKLWAYKVGTNFRRGLLQRGDELELSR